MDGIGWDDSLVGMNKLSSWSNQQHEIGDSCFDMSNSNCFMNPIQPQELQKIDSLSSSRVNPNALALGSELNLSRHEEATNNLAKSRAAGMMKWADFGNQQPSVSGFQEATKGAGVSTTTGSLESLDCLLSATNSPTDTSAEDDGISMMFSECENLWNFGANISSGDSVNSKDNRPPPSVNEVDETASQCLYRATNNQAVVKTNKANHRPTTKRSNIDVRHQIQPNYSFKTDCGYPETGFQLITENNNTNNPRKPKKPRSSDKPTPYCSSSSINFQQQPSLSSSDHQEPDSEAIAQMKEMIYRAAAFRPVNLGVEVVDKPKRKNVKISSDPQTVAARQRRERISERIRVLQRMVPGGSKMDTASMLDEAANYLKFLRSQIKALENLGGGGGHKLDFVMTSRCPTPTSLVHPYFSSSPPFNNYHPFPPMQNPFSPPKP